MATIRSQVEGGDWRDSESARLALYRAVIPQVQIIDVELGAREIRQEVLKAVAHAEHPPVVVLSFHDFADTPRLELLQEKVDLARAAGADIVKIATMVESPTDLRILAALLINNAAQPLVVIGMGAYGSLSRIAFGALGSLWTFAHLREPTAPGQLTLEQTTELLELFYPRYHATPEG